MCNSGGVDAMGATLDFTNNLAPSPSPPGNLSPQDAPQIVVFGFDDIESAAGVTFVQSLLGGVTNPDGSKAMANFNPNACYAQDPLYVCGDGTLGTARSTVSGLGFDWGNHTIDHLESNSTWSGIPSKYKDPNTGSWLFDMNGNGPGIAMDAMTWQQILQVNETELGAMYQATVTGLRAPRLEVNDNGLQAASALKYEYDQNLEEIQPDGYIEAAIAVNTDGGKGFNWLPWPYTLDNGSPGIWNQQVGGDKGWVTNYPQGLWEIPVYQVYIPSANGLGTTIANRMMAADKSCTLPSGMPPDQSQDCFLSPGELSPGQAEKEVTGFDFNTFIYCRMQQDEWLTVMKHTFLMRYYGNRAPLTYGAHPIEYTQPYDAQTLETQANNYGYRDVVMWNTYDKRQAAMTAFRDWIKNDPTFSKDTYFMSAKQLADYMQHPFDKNHQPVSPDTVATPDSNGLFSRLGWTTQGAMIQPMSGNSASITWNIPTPASGNAPAISYVSAGLAAGSLQNVSHIDIKYNTQVPFRIRLLASDGSSVTALLAGVTGERQARLRMKDFFLGPEASADEVANAAPVDSNYMAKVTGIAIESAATQVAPSGTPGTFAGGTFTTNVEQITLHGVATSSLCQ